VGCPLSREFVFGCQLFLRLANAVFLWSESRGSIYHILLSQFWYFSQSGRTGSCILPRNTVSQIYLTQFFVQFNIKSRFQQFPLMLSNCLCRENVFIKRFLTRADSSGSNWLVFQLPTWHIFCYSQLKFKLSTNKGQWASMSWYHAITLHLRQIILSLLGIIFRHYGGGN
jgi:hypothetical protein